MLGWSQSELAIRSGVAKRSIAGLELETSVPTQETMNRLVSTLSGGGIEFRNSDADGVGIMLRRGARSSKDKAASEVAVTLRPSDRT